MFSLISGVYQSYFASQQLNLLIVGPEGSGKTVLLERLKVTQFSSKKVEVNVQPAAPLAAAVMLGKNHTDNNDNNNYNTEMVEAPVFNRKTTAARAQQQQHQHKQHPTASPSMTTRRRLAGWVCPAPPKYANAADKDEKDNDNDDDMNAGPGKVQEQEPLVASTDSQEKGTDESHNQSRRSVDMPARSSLPRRTSTQGSMESVELNDGPAASQRSSQQQPQPAAARSHSVQRQRSAAPAPAVVISDVDIKPKSKMLPLSRIRPTIGMNLAKIEICGAVCHVQDLGGRLQDLWDRYYNDCDAVIYVWKLPEQSQSQQEEESQQEQHEQDGAADDSDSDSDDGRPELTPELQLRLLERVRGAAADDVPFLVLGHDFEPSVSSQRRCPPDVLFSTAQLLPHYHNPLQALFFANAATGQGVRSALEWLIPLAKRQQRVRERAALTEDLEK